MFVAPGRPEPQGTDSPLPRVRYMQVRCGRGHHREVGVYRSGSCAARCQMLWVYQEQNARFVALFLVTGHSSYRPVHCAHTTTVESGRAWPPQSASVCRVAIMPVQAERSVVFHDDSLYRFNLSIIGYRCLAAGKGPRLAKRCSVLRTRPNLSCPPPPGEHCGRPDPLGFTV